MKISSIKIRVIFQKSLEKIINELHFFIYIKIFKNISNYDYITFDKIAYIYFLHS